MVNNLRLLSGNKVLARSVELSVDISDEQRLASGVVDGDESTLDDGTGKHPSANEQLTDADCVIPSTRFGDRKFSMERSPAASHGVDLDSGMRSELRKLSALRRKTFSFVVECGTIPFRLHERATEILAVISDTSPPTFSGEYSSKEFRTEDDDNDIGG